MKFDITNQHDELWASRLVRLTIETDHEEALEILQTAKQIHEDRLVRETDEMVNKLLGR